MRIRFRSKASDPGQASLEFALVLPLVVIIVAATVWIGAVVRLQLHLDHLAYHAGRLAAAATSRVELDDVVADALGADGTNGAVRHHVVIDDDLVTVHVQRRLPAPPIVGRLVSDHTLQSSATFRLEYELADGPNGEDESR